jgi:hypothetical protein
MNPEDQKDQQKAKALIDGCIATMSALSDLMEREAKLVKARDVKGLQVLVAEKNKLTLEYRTSLKNIAQDPALVKKAPPEMRNLLKLEGQRLAEATVGNERLLKAAVLGTRRLVEAIYTAIRREALPDQGYLNTRKKKSRKESGESGRSVVICRSA